MKLLGAALLLVSAGWLGGSWKRAQTRRLAVLDALDRTLSRLGPELERGMPLPVFFTGEGAREPLLTGPFSRAAAALERGLGAEQALLAELALLRELCPESAEALRALIPLLGRYDSGTQRSACVRARERLAREREQIDRERTRQGRLRQTVTMCAGALLVLALW